MEYADAIVNQRERLYLARTTHLRRQITGVDAMHRSDGIAAWRWWSLAEIEATDEHVWPPGLADLIESALAGRLWRAATVRGRPGRCARTPRA